MTLSMTSSLFNTYSQNQALIAKGKANQQQAQNYITSMNYSFQNLEQERMDAFEAAVSELENTKIQGNRLEAQVNAAVNEGLEGGGRTADLIKRAAQADTNRATASIKENYAKKSNEIDLNKEMALINAKQQIKSIQDVEKPSLFGTVLGIATAYYNAREHEEQMQAIRDKAYLGTDSKNTPITTPTPAPVPTPQIHSYATVDWDTEFAISDNYTHFSFNGFKNPYAGYNYRDNFGGVQKNYFW